MNEATVMLLGMIVGGVLMLVGIAVGAWLMGRKP